MLRLLVILIVGLVFEAIGVVLLSRGLKEVTLYFTPRDLKDFSSLAAKLTTHPDPVSGFIWKQLAAAEQQELRNASADAAGGKRVLSEALNRLLVRPDLYQIERFADVTLSPETREVLAENPKGNELLRLNRALLDDTYRAELTRQGTEKTSVPQILRLVGRGVTNAHIFFGVFFEALFFVALLMLMAKADVSFVWPLTSLSFVVTTIAAKIYLQEQVSGLRWSGVCLIMMGAALISWTEKNRAPAARHPEAIQTVGRR